MRRSYVYVLVDPRDRKVRYVGVTQNPKQREQAHGCVASALGNAARRDWVADLRFHGMRPELLVIGCVWENVALQAEKEAIAFHLSIGARLLNWTVPFTPRDTEERKKAWFSMRLHLTDNASMCVDLRRRQARWAKWRSESRRMTIVNMY